MANIEEILAFADGADRLTRGERTFSPASLALFVTWRDVQEYAASYAGRDLLPIVQIIDRQGDCLLARYVVTRIAGSRGGLRRVDHSSRERTRMEPCKGLR
ncbi:hypothetical protein BCAR13_1840003 [Paraburkholderia caribensis]|nr:hypothetical protein BCAR13_1840003 [Paraburkholderia caribensis]